MKIERFQVTSESEVVGEVEVKFFDSLSEMVGELGEAEVLKLAQTQYKTTLMNRERQRATGKISKEDLEVMVLTRIATDPSILEQVRPLAGDPQKLAEFKNQLAEQIQSEEMAKRRRVRPQAVTANV